MRRRLPLLSAIACLLLAVPVGALWERSHETEDQVALARTGWGFTSGSSNSGWIAVNFAREWTRPPLTQHRWHTRDPRNAFQPHVFPIFVEVGPGRDSWALGVHVSHGPVEVFVDQAEAMALMAPTPRPAAVIMTTTQCPTGY